MTFAAGDHVKIVVKQSFLNQLVLNVFHYEMVDSGTLTAVALAQAFWDDIKAGWRGMVTTGVNFNQVDVYDNDDPLGEFGSYAIPLAERLGVYGALNFPPNIAYGFKLTVPTRVTKPGALRIVGIRTDGVDTGGTYQAAQVTVVNTFRTAFINGFRPGAAGTIGGLPVVYGAPHNASSRYPARETAVYSPVTDIVLQPYITTQNTRKYGRGA